MKVFLGGTCNDSDWRDKIIPMLTIDYFNPVVPDWNQQSYIEELKQRKECDINLYVITPKMTGVYSIAEVVDDSNKRKHHSTVFVMLRKDGEQEFTFGQWKSLAAVEEMVKNNGAKVCKSLKEAAEFCNNFR